jgi:hypothetical protein
VAAAVAVAVVVGTTLVLFSTISETLVEVALDVWEAESVVELVYCLF